MNCCLGRSLLRHWWLVSSAVDAALHSTIHQRYSCHQHPSTKISGCRKLLTECTCYCCPFFCWLHAQLCADNDDPSPARSRKELCTTLLARKHPVPFFQFLDCCARSSQTDADDKARICSLLINACSKIGSKAMADLPNSPAATAALASAMASIVKLYAQQLQGWQAAAAAVNGDFDEYVWNAMGAPSKMPMLLLEAVSTMLQHVSCCAAGTSVHNAVLDEAAVQQASSIASSSSSSSAGTGQQGASTLLLLVLVCRGLLVLHEALLQLPKMSGLRLDTQLHEAAAPTAGAARVQQEFVTNVLRVFDNVRAVLHSCFKEQQAAAAAGFMTGQHATTSSSSSESSSSSSSSRRVRWQYLLQLQESRKLMKAVHALEEVWSADTNATSCISTDLTAAEELSPSCSPAMVEGTAAAGSSKQPGLTQQQLQQLRAALQFCRVLVSVSPLPVVCNNPGCVQLGGASEAAAARFMCAGCGCRYCSAACQAAGWRGHKKACRRMADCGMRVQG
jgi:hypothetical protein